VSRFTKVGPPNKNDQPRKRRGFLGRLGLVWTYMNPAAWFLASKEAEKELPEQLTGTSAADKLPSHGLSEADLSEAQRDAAAEHLKQEEALRRARGDR
jgi:hypothetical protein